LSDQEIADVATYIRNAWGNAAPAVTPAEVAKARRVP
jgi:mono/diheme cytochrome c family protein